MPTLEALHAEVQALKRRVASIFVGGGSPPGAHATSHHSGGSDVLALGSIAGSLVIGQVPNDLLTNAKLVNMADGTIKGRALGAGTGDQTDLTAAQAKAIIAPQLEATVGATFAGDDLVAGVTRIVRVPHGLTPTTWVVFSDATISIAIDIWADTLANYPPTDADTITGGNEPEVSGAAIDDGDASAFDPLVAGDFVAFTIDTLTVGSATWATVQLFGTRT